MDLLIKIEQKLDSLIMILQQRGQDNNKAMLNADEAASYLGISKSTLYKHTSAGNLAFYKPNGKLLLFCKKELDQWLGVNRIQSNQELSDLSSNFSSLK